MSNCFFIGHREASRRVFPSIIEAAERLVSEKGVNVFYVGAYGNFDHMAGEAIIQLKRKYPTIQLYLVIPYHPALRPIKMPPGYNNTFYPDGMECVSNRYAIVKANQKMIDSCDWLIAYVTHSVSNAHKLLEYAISQEKKGLIRVVNLGGKTGDE